MSQKILRLHCRVQGYDWGGAEFIPSLLGVENSARRPYAELWMGAHPDMPAVAEVDGERVPLDALIERAPEEILGADVARAFEGRLPYLFKVLSAAKALSIQAHPSRAAASKGFADENDRGVSMSAEGRNYRDENHKPELIVALTDFHGLCGFRPLEEVAQTLMVESEFQALMPDFEPTSECLRTLYKCFMALPQGDVDAVLEPLIARLEKAHQNRPFSREEREYWVLRANREHAHGGRCDRGLFSIYLLNLVHLKPGDALFLPAGILHAYLEGAGVEIMANSNNVLRGGLTTKHVDPPELTANVIFEGGVPEILGAEQTSIGTDFLYRTPAREFELHRLEVDAARQHDNPAARSAEILLSVGDEESLATVESGADSVELKRGEVLLVPYGVPYTIRAADAVTIFKATVPADVGG